MASMAKVARFAEKLRRLREQAGLSQRALAKEPGYTYTHIQNLEKGKSMPGADFVVTLAKYFAVTPDQLLLDELGPASVRGG